MSNEASEHCDHMEFSVEANVSRLVDKDDGKITGFAFDCMVKCRYCGLPFRFKEKRVGMLNDQATINPNGQELRCYIEPSDGSLVGSALMPQFVVTAHRTAPPVSDN